MKGLTANTGRFICVGLLVVASLPASDSFCVGSASTLVPRIRRHAGGYMITRRNSRSRCQTKLGVQIREWRKEDVDQIQSLLSDATSTAFDPEGPLDNDAESAAAIRESYNVDDGGCFLVATNDSDSNSLLGTAALIVGTQVSYLKSGASISTPKITGAVRRVCTVNEANGQSSESIICSMIKEIETRAAQSGATELILLAYPSTARRPNAKLLESMGYHELPTKLPGVDAVQYTKHLTDTDDSNSSLGENVSNGNNAIGQAAVATTIVAGLLFAFGFVANIMGLEILPSTDTNRGIGSPLSIQEVERLKQDEQLKRTSLDGASSKQSRQWEDLGMEECREEAALMRIIQGQDIRLQ